MRISPIICRTDSKRWGLGASMNNGLREAFKYSDIVLRTEDDWYLEKKLYLEPMVDLLKKNNEAAGIRLAMIGKGVGTDPKITLAKGYKSLTGSKTSWIFNNQVMLVHKRTHDLLGWYKENIGADKEETEFKDRFNEKTDGGKKKLHLFCPSSIKWCTLDDSSLWFIHVGRSTLGHEVYREPPRYSWIYKVNDPKKAKENKEKRKEEQRILDNKAIDKILKTEKKIKQKKEEPPKKFFKPQRKEIKIKPEAIVEQKKEEQKKTIELKNKDFDVIVSVATHKGRLSGKNLEHTLRSILNQKTKFSFHIVVNIPKDDKAYIQKSLKEFCSKHKIEIFLCDNNLRSHNKYFYSFQRYKKYPIILIDDDLIYDDDLIDSLYRKYLNNPYCVYARRTHYVRTRRKTELPIVHSLPEMFCA